MLDVFAQDVALVELDSSDSSEEEEKSGSEESSDGEQVTEQNIRLGQKRKKAKIEVLTSNSQLKQS